MTTDLARRRASAQLLDRPAELTDPADVLRRAAGIQAQDPVAALLGVRARARSVTANDVFRARGEDRSIVRVWAMRGTLHLLATEDLAWQEPLYAEKELAWARRRMSDGFGLDRRTQDKASRVVGRLLEREGVVARKDALTAIAEAGVEFERASVGHHLARLPVLEGTALLGPERGRETTYVLKGDWIQVPSPMAREEALAELARRYLTAFGPATEADFSAWSGLPLRDCRAGLAAIASELEEAASREGVLLSVRGAARRLPRPGQVRMLPAFDNHYLAHRDRAFAIEPAQHTKVFPGGGIIRPTVAVDGRAAATWRTSRAGGRLTVEVEPLGPLDGSVRKAIEAEVKDIGRFEGISAILRRLRRGRPPRYDHAPEEEGN